MELINAKLALDTATQVIQVPFSQNAASYQVIHSHGLAEDAATRRFDIATELGVVA